MENKITSDLVYVALEIVNDVLSRGKQEKKTDNFCDG